MLGWTRGRDRRAAQRWEEFCAAAARQNLHLLQVLRVYQVARRGTKAVVQPYGRVERRDAWFWWARVSPGSVVAVRESVGYGPHTNRDGVVYIGSKDGGGGVHATVDARTVKRAGRHWRRTRAAASSAAPQP